MRFTIEDKRLIKWMWVSKKSCSTSAQRLLEMFFFDKVKSWWAKDIDKKTV